MLINKQHQERNTTLASTTRLAKAHLLCCWTSDRHPGEGLSAHRVPKEHPNGHQSTDDPANHALCLPQSTWRPLKIRKTSCHAH